MPRYIIQVQRSNALNDCPTTIVVEDVTNQKDAEAEALAKANAQTGCSYKIYDVRVVYTMEERQQMEDQESVGDFKNY